MEVYDRIIRNEKQHALEIQELKQNDADKTEEINFLKQQIEEIQVSNPPETCAHLGKQGVTRTQDIFIDSDGVNQGTIFPHIVSAETISFRGNYSFFEFGNPKVKVHKAKGHST